MQPRPTNHGKPWTDSDIDFVLDFPPTAESCRIIAEELGRTPGSIGWLFQMATKPKNHLSLGHQQNIFVQQVRRAVTRKGWMKLTA